MLFSGRGREKGVFERYLGSLGLEHQEVRRSAVRLLLAARLIIASIELNAVDLISISLRFVKGSDELKVLNSRSKSICSEVCYEISRQKLGESETIRFERRGLIWPFLYTGPILGSLSQS